MDARLLTPANIRRIACAFCAMVYACATLAAADRDDFGDDDVRRIERVNDGPLAFLPQPPLQPVHHHDNRIEIGERSLEDGWVTLRQCHSNMDVFGRVEIVFHSQRIRALRIIESAEIGKAWVEGPAIQLEDVGKGARLCLEAESRALMREADGYYYLRNGPFMRRFLDGYYPMHVTAEIVYPIRHLRITDVQPTVQPGMSVKHAPGMVHIDAWFEGQLNTRVVFKPSATE